MKVSLFGPAYAALFKDIGEPTLRTAAELRNMQEKRVGRSNPNTFYATFDPRPEPKVTWSYNIGAHFNRRPFSYQCFFAAIHPFWLPIYAGMAEFTHKLMVAMEDEQITKELIVTANVPLKNNRGKYYWYDQVSFPASFDAKGAMVEYLNEFHCLAEFDRMVPSRPSLTNRGNRVEAFDLQLREELGPLLNKSLLRLLSPTSFKLLNAYRFKLASDQGTNREEMSRSLGIRLQALDKGNVRMLAQARLAFPTAMLTSVSDLAKSLNDSFGAPVGMKYSVS